MDSVAPSEQPAGGAKPGDTRTRLIPESRLPTSSYKINCASYTYSLSELVFGSLLASYILGFFGFGMNLANNLPDAKSFYGLLISFKLIQIIQYLCISGVFSYLTAAYYVTYHNSILTMPHIPSYKLRTDFGIALMQAVMFGLSMIRPDGFLFFVGVSLVRVFWRQQDVCKELSELFQRLVGPRHGRTIDHSIEQREFNRMLKEINSETRYCKCLDGWLPVAGWMKAFAVFLILAGISSELRHYIDSWQTYTPKSSIKLAWLQTVVYLSLFLSVWGFSARVFKKGADHPRDKQDEEHFAIDNAAEQIAIRLKEMNSKSTSS